MCDQETGTAEAEPDQVTSEGQNYWEIMRGVRSYMDWNQVPEFESSVSQDDNPFASSRNPSKLERLNSILTEGYHIHSTDTN